MDDIYLTFGHPYFHRGYFSIKIFLIAEQSGQHYYRNGILNTLLYLPQIFFFVGCPKILAADMAEKNQIPVVDLSTFATESSTESRLESARALYKACHELGFVQIQGLEPQLIREAFDWSTKLYSLPHGEKMKAPHPDGPMPHRGFSPF